MAEPLMTQISLYACNFPPNQWKWCTGELMTISTYQSLFSLLGTNFGGDGRTSFGLPDLRGRMPIGTGTSDITSTRVIGNTGGSQTVYLDINTIPSHTHTSDGHGTTTGHLNGSPNTNSAVKCNNTTSNTTNPMGKVWGKFDSEDSVYADEPGDSDEMHVGLIGANVDMSTVQVNVDTDLHSIELESAGYGIDHENSMPYLAVPYCIAVVGLYPSRN
ncbi:MAG: hypothetical protein GY765_43015 [bacterium]|nr:hypothetical protein [bacterium]